METTTKIEKGAKDLSKLVKKKITDKTGHTRTVWVRAGEKIKEGRKKVKEKISEVKEKQEAKYDAHEGASLLRKKMNGVVKGVKNEIKEWKDASSGVKKLVTGGELTDHEKHAMKTVAIHVGIVVAMAITGGTGGATTLAAKAATLGTKIGLGYLEHAGIMNIGHALAFAKAEGEDDDAAKDDKKPDTKAKGKEEEMDDDIAEHYMQRMVLSMSNYMEKQGKEQASEGKEESKDDGKQSDKKESTTEEK